MMESADDERQRRKRPRKSRGRGLRTRTGCLTCRKRHKKCDEKQPVCGPCTVSSRHCVFPHDLDAQDALEALTRGPPAPVAVTAAAPGHHVGRQVQSNGDHSLPSASETTVSHSPSITSHSPGLVLAPQSAASPANSQSHISNKPVIHPPPPSSHPAPHPPPPPRHDVNIPVQTLGCSPDSLAYEEWSADFASTRWLDLLANDAAQADSGFSLAPSPAPESRDTIRHSAISTHVSPALLNGQAQLPENLDPESERRAWQSDQDITLTNHEAELFRHFAEKCARWLDIFDPRRWFSTYAIRLALQNQGLMKAILALSTKHRSKCLEKQAKDAAAAATATTALSPNNTPNPDTNNTARRGGEGGNVVDSEDNEWIRYYYETLHYIREALIYSSYTHSEELLATAIVISAYEMLDESDGSGNWQRHLKGVFWIQRSQDVDGGCGGLRQAVWWAWLRQDVWAAFREKRPCLSFWRAKRDVEELDQHGLADRAIYLLSQAVNYSTESRKADAVSSLDPSASMQRKRHRDDLVAKLERWRTCLGDEYNTLPTSKSPSDVFTPLWVHPPQFGVALQAYSFAQILVTLHSPNTTGFSGFLKMQRTLAEAVETICGIAMELKEESCQIMSAQCLYGAGLCVHDPVKREKIISMMEECESRVGWTPMATWRDDLRLEWVKADGETP